MATYFVINILFIAATMLVFRLRPHKQSHVWWLMVVALCVLTAVFDSMLVYFSFIDYNPDLISGIRIGFAPIEDFFYAIYAAIMVPYLWKQFGKGEDE